MPRLKESQFLKFPFTIKADGPLISTLSEPEREQIELNAGGPLTSTRSEHVREQIEQVLFTSPKERVFRPEFGVGVRRLVFEPNNIALRNTTIKRLDASLADALFGEVDPRTLQIDVSNVEEQLVIHISYVLAAINKQESYQFVIDSAGGV